MEQSAMLSACEMAGNPELILFTSPSSCRRAARLHDLIAAFGGEVTHVTLGFTPLDTDGFDCHAYREDDCNFFVRGEGLSDFAAMRLRIPGLSHA